MKGALVIATLVMCAGAQATEFISGVARILDGDTLDVGNIRVRLKGIAAPELSEPGGVEAAAFLFNLVGGRVIRCELTGEHTYGRRVGWCILGEHDIAAAEIAAGLARDCPRWSGGIYASTERPEAARLPLPSYCLRR